MSPQFLPQPAVRVLARRGGPLDAGGGEEVGEGGYAGECGDELWVSASGATEEGGRGKEGRREEVQPGAGEACWETC